MISKVAKSSTKNIFYILFCLLLIFIPFKVEAKVEKIGTKNLEISLSKDYDITKRYKLTLPLKNTSNEEQQVYYELTGFKTKENKPITVELYEKEDVEPRLTYNGASVITKEPSTFEGGAEKSITIEFKFDQKSDEYSGKLTIHSLIPPTNERAGTSELEEVNFTFKKYIEPKKEPSKLTLEVNYGSKEAIYINKVIGSFSGENEDYKSANDTKGQPISNKGYNINLANKTKEHPIKNVIIQPSSFVKAEGDKKISERFDVQKYRNELPSIGINKSEVVSLPMPEISKPGTYKIKFNIEADGVEPQQVEAIVQARYSAWVAVIVLLLGSFLSYFVTRVIIIFRAKYGRSALIKRIRREVEDYTDDNEYLKERIRALAK